MHALHNRIIRDIDRASRMYPNVSLNSIVDKAVAAVFAQGKKLLAERPVVRAVSPSAFLLPEETAYLADALARKAEAEAVSPADDEGQEAAIQAELALMERRRKAAIRAELEATIQAEAPVKRVLTPKQKAAKNARARERRAERKA